ncbi:uncharacterized protein [Dermacentor albipictus]|uniref:uncharacterized protein isoform X1 n=1 Tax=Dermacentor albipictus TaxID=60249 RepID=UPI0031FD78D7
MSALYSARYVLIGTITLQGMFICFGKPTAFPTISDGNGTTAPPYKCGQVVYVTSPMASCGSPIPLQTHYGSYSAELFHSFALFGCERDSKGWANDQSFKYQLVTIRTDIRKITIRVFHIITVFRSLNKPLEITRSETTAKIFEGSYLKNFGKVVPTWHAAQEEQRRPNAEPCMKSFFSVATGLLGKRDGGQATILFYSP